MFGDQWSNVIHGLGGNDFLDGGGLDDSLYGGGGGDTFQFAQNSGWDSIFDFQEGLDLIDLGHWGFSSVAQALSYASASASGVRFDFADGSHLSVFNIASVNDLADDILIV